MLVNAAFWFVHVSKEFKDAQSKYDAPLKW